MRLLRSPAWWNGLWHSEHLCKCILPPQLASAYLYILILFAQIRKIQHHGVWQTTKLFTLETFLKFLKDISFKDFSDFYCSLFLGFCYNYSGPPNSWRLSIDIYSWMDRIFITDTCAWGYKYCMWHLCLQGVGCGGGVHFHHFNMGRSFIQIVEVWCKK